jgi:hypothetical protein
MRFRYLFLGIIFLSCITHAVDKPSNLPRFTFHKMKTGEGIVSLVVPQNTTDGQLDTLLRFIRDKVQQRKFADLGIGHPTDKSLGKLGYGAGIIAVYRGERCANEQFIDDLGPCGYGEHDSASYQWGIEGDSRKDSGLVIGNNGDFRKVF